VRILVYWEQESWGGVDSHLLELLRTWPNQKDEIVLLVNEGNIGFERLKANFSSLPYVRCVLHKSYSHNEISRRLRGFKRPRFFSWFLYFALPLTYFISVYRQSKVFRRLGKFDALLSDNGGYPAAWGAISAIEAAAKAGIKARLLLIHHSATSPGPLMRLFEWIVDVRLMRYASALVCVSHATRAELLKRRWIDEATVRIRVIHNSISLEAESVPQAVENIRAITLTDTKIFLIGIVGRIEPYKGHEDLIFALARLTPKQREKIRLVVIGSSTSTNEVPRLNRIARNLGVADNLQFLGYLEGRPVDLIAQLDLLVVATRSFEGFGLTLIEAMSVNTPVLATRVGAIPQFVNENNGLLVAPASPAELADALVQFIEEPQPWRRRAEVAREMIKVKQIVMAHEYRRLFIECLA
jgi:glycosyltransferase involved in cell wall biosynthesis